MKRTIIFTYISQINNMEEYTLIQIRLPKDFDYKLNLLMTRLKQLNIKTTKADTIVNLAGMQINKELEETT